MEKSYGATVAASLREPPFVLASVINHNCHFSQLVWFNESIDMAHLHTFFTVKNSNFDSVARQLIAISPDVLSDLAKHLEQEKGFSNLTSEQHHALDLLKKVNTISACIPGSQASKIFI